ncbi:Ig-like domain-containing protein [Cohnella zeiphila]|uniref:Ig-like domain-containing protein n=1 Tax=Cohnella zeiphila TaxID=2761120 RepID=A0A7X0VVT1_9BACL|nr:Ig-like domain-containing protein [Cohnella zeiphila]MBB6732474.1 Ig-like domain-containing protein [Cohnella zeiphila]
MRNDTIQVSRRKRPYGRPVLFRLLAALLLAALFWGQASGLAHAEDTVTGVELSPIDDKTVYVNDDSIALTLWATISGSSSKKDVTSVATWTSSNSAVSVSGGVVTATASAANAVITGKYGGYTATVALNAAYRYKSVEIRQNDAAVDSKMDIKLGDTIVFTAEGIPTTGTGVNVTDDAAWTTSNSSVATVDGGEVTLVASGTATITVSYLGRTDSVALTVASPYKSLSIDQTGPIEKNVDDDAIKLTATAQLKTGGTEDVTNKVTWSSSNSGVATVDEEGSVSFVGVGTADITATYLGVSGKVTVVVRTPSEALRLSQEKTLKLSLQDDKFAVKANAVKDASSSEDVSLKAQWTSSDLVVATVGIENGTVYVTPKSAGTTTIKAEYKGLSRSFTLIVYPTVTSLKIDKDSLDAFVDETGAFPSVTGEALSGDTVDLTDSVTWTSSDDSIVSIEDGQWKAVKTGAATLKATLKSGDDTLTASFDLQVNKKVHMLLADTDSVSIITGQEVAYPTIHVVYEDGDEEDLTDKIEWTSGSANVLVKDSTHTWKGLVASKATLTGTYLNATVKVNAVVEDEYIVYTIDPASIDLTIKKTKSIKVTGKTKAGKKVSLGSRIEWTSSDESVLTVNGASVKSLAEGSGKLTATFQGKTLTVPFTVKAKLTKLSASNPSLELAPGASAAVKITALYENGKTVDVTSAALWTATSTKVATVSGGVIKAVAKGSTTLKATFDGKTVTVRVKVTK